MRHNVRVDQHSDTERFLDIGASVRVVIVKLSRQLNVSAAHERLTPTEASVLGIIAFRGPISLSQLAGIEALNPTMVSRVVGKLDDRGLVRRVPNEHDLRSVTVEITREGAEVNERIRAERARTVAESMASISPEHREAIVAAIPALDALADDLIVRRASR